MIPGTPNDRRHAGGANPAMPWVIVGVVAMLFLVAGALWTAAQLAAAAGHRVPSVGRLPGVLAHRGLVAVLGPGGSPPMFYLAVTVQGLLLLAALVAVWVAVRRHQPRDGRSALVNASNFTDL